MHSPHPSTDGQHKLILLVDEAPSTHMQLKSATDRTVAECSPLSHYIIQYPRNISVLFSIVIILEFLGTASCVGVRGFRVFNKLLTSWVHVAAPLSSCCESQDLPWDPPTWDPWSRSHAGCIEGITRITCYASLLWFCWRTQECLYPVNCQRKRLASPPTFIGTMDWCRSSRLLQQPFHFSGFGMVLSSQPTPYIAMKM